MTRPDELVSILDRIFNGCRDEGILPAILRQYLKVRKRTLANLSKLPDHAIDGLQLLLKGGTAIESLPEAFKIIRSRPHGHVAAVLGSLKNTGLHHLIHEENTRERRLVLAMIVARIIDPGSKLATSRGMSSQTCCSSLGEILGLSGVDEDELYLVHLLLRRDGIKPYKSFLLRLVLFLDCYSMKFPKI
ncbi:hypothetical protein [Chlorogloeopsis sp. ULAP02]|uniref:hypothetical protein n=1 Tax=Chlorogloeopsis sp. ULAP02 TaxID=3107926 RepID=UPI0031360717